MTNREAELLQYSPNPDAVMMAHSNFNFRMSTDARRYLEECEQQYYAKICYSTTLAWRNV